jgi:hypothetical protein
MLIRKKKSEATKEKMRKSHTGKKMSEATKIKISQKLKGRVSPFLGHKHSKETIDKIIATNWKGENITKSEGRHRARKMYPCPKGYERHHIDGNPLNNDPYNIRIVKRKEHLVIDGRIKNLELGRLGNNYAN